jgi:hypothetical protein
VAGRLKEMVPVMSASTPVFRSVPHRKLPAKRAFTGLAGSPLASVEPTPEPKTKRGRPRKHQNDASKQSAYRKTHNERIAKAEAAKAQDDAINAVLKSSEFSMNRGMYMTDAPQGCGLIVYVGSRRKSELIEGKKQTEEEQGGKRIQPRGNAPDDAEEDHDTGKEKKGDEKEHTFAPKHFPKNWKLTPREREMIMEGTTKHKMTCRTHSANGPIPAKWDSTIGLWSLECGCTRGFCPVCNHPIRGLDSKLKCVCEKKGIS